MTSNDNGSALVARQPADPVGGAPAKLAQTWLAAAPADPGETLHQCVLLVNQPSKRAPRARPDSKPQKKTAEEEKRVLIFRLSSLISTKISCSGWKTLKKQIFGRQLCVCVWMQDAASVKEGSNK